MSFIVAGAGTRTNRLIRYLWPYCPKYIVDRDPSKWGTFIGEHQVFPPFYFSEHVSDAVVIASLNYFAIVADLGVTSKKTLCFLPPVEIIYGYD